MTKESQREDVRAEVMEAYKRSNERFRRLYEMLAKTDTGPALDEGQSGQESGGAAGETEK